MQATDGTYEMIEEKRVNEAGDTVLKRYERGRFLGKGGFAKCYELRDIDSGKLLAAKIIDKASLNKGRAKQKLLSEIKIHRSMRHPGVVRFEGYFEDSQRVFILLELCPNQTLKELIKRRKRLHELEVQCLMGQIVTALRHIHGQNVIHRDLKLGNVFLGRNYEAKIGDFGLAAQLDHSQERRRTVCGTPNYIAPEVLAKTAGHSFEADIWSLGALLYAMLIGKPPFETSNVKATYRKIRANEYSIPEDPPVSREAQDLIRAILVQKPESRPTLVDILNHPFMTKNTVPKQLPATVLTMAPTPEFLKLHAKPDRPPTSGTPSTSSFTAAAVIAKPPVVRVDKTNVKLNAAVSLASLNSPTTRPTTSASNAPDHPPSASVKGLLMTNNYMTSVPQGMARGMSSDRKLDGKSSARPESRPDSFASTISKKNIVLATSTDMKLGHAQTPAQGRTQVPSHTQILTPVGATLNSAKATLRLPGSMSQTHFGTEPHSSPSPSPSLPQSQPQPPGTASESARTPEYPAIYIQYYQDSTTKYGIGYILTNGLLGFYYNDMTNLLWVEPKGQYAYSDFYGKPDGVGDAFRYITGKEGSSDIEKKMKIISHFRGWVAKLPDFGKTSSTLPEVRTGGGVEVAVKRFVKTRSGILFRLTNNIVQMAFSDSSQIVLCFRSKMLTYINKKGKTQTLKAENELILQAGEKIMKRYKYTLNLLHYVNNNRGLGSGNVTRQGKRESSKHVNS
jgi:serine/threonine protein kinase